MSFVCTIIDCITGFVSVVNFTLITTTAAHKHQMIRLLLLHPLAERASTFDTEMKSIPRKSGHSLSRVLRYCYSYSSYSSYYLLLLLLQRPPAARATTVHTTTTAAATTKAAGAALVSDLSIRLEVLGKCAECWGSPGKRNVVPFRC